MKIEIGCKREEFLRMISDGLNEDDGRVDVEFCDLEGHVCAQCSDEIDGIGYIATLMERDEKGSISSIYFHSDCYDRFLDRF